MSSSPRAMVEIGAMEAGAGDVSEAERVERLDRFGWDEVLPELGSDETDAGWGEDRAAPDPADLRRFLDDKPPHHM
ncbi:hypothetical protein [Embleya sp. AB8]|uniref:hypothetical protein n=1 Tax=Embleya sp. AB8 TaxID=3156304 RepID=UPI003C760E3E